MTIGFKILSKFIKISYLHIAINHKNFQHCGTLIKNLSLVKTMVCYLYTTPWQRRVVDDDSKWALS